MGDAFQVKKLKSVQCRGDTEECNPSNQKDKYLGYVVMLINLYFFPVCSWHILTQWRITKEQEAEKKILCF